jgi:hypothetical protein
MLEREGRIPGRRRIERWLLSPRFGCCNWNSHDGGETFVLVKSPSGNSPGGKNCSRQLDTEGTAYSIVMFTTFSTHGHAERPSHETMFHVSREDGLVGVLS